MTQENLSEKQDLHVFLQSYVNEQSDDVVIVDEAVSADQGVSGLIAELTSRGRREMLLCRKVDGLDVELVTNVFASRARVARILGTDLPGLHETYQARAAQARPLRVVASGPVLDSVVEGDDVDLATVPMIRHFESDRAEYITSAIVVAEDAELGVANMSYHRSMRHSRNELATSLHSRGHLWRMLQAAGERGKSLPVALVIGGHPLFMLAASARVAFDVDERVIAGGLFGESLEVVQTPRYGIGVPATAEIVLEGTIDVRDHAEEGPFGEFSGYSSDRSTNNLLKVETILRRRDAVLLDVMGGNFDEHLNLARIPRESEMAATLKERFPDVTGLFYPNSGTHFHCYVALKQRRPGVARQVLLGLLGWDPYLKVAVAVDEDVDITDDAEVLWAMATHFQPHKDLFIVDGLPGSPLDPSSSISGTTSRMAIDATRGPEFQGVRIRISPEAIDRARHLLGDPN